MADFEDLPEQNTNNPPTTNTPKLPQEEHQNNSFYQNGVVPVKEMQQALINLSRDITSQNIHNVKDRYSKEDETSRDLLNGSNAFFNFMVTDYMNKARVTGKQLVNVDINQPTRMDTSKKNDNFIGVLKSIQRIGTPGQEEKPDGIWGPRTNNALKEVYSLAFALINIVDDMKLRLNGYSSEDLKELQSNIPANIEKTSLDEKLEKATILSKNLNKLRNLYDSFIENILNNQTYYDHISQKKPLIVVHKINENSNKNLELTEYEKSLFKNNKSLKINISLNGKKTSIMLGELESMDNFKKFLNDQKNILTEQELASINSGDKQTINKFLIEVANGLEQ